MPHIEIDGNELLAALAAIGQGMQEEFDPQHFLDGFAGQMQRVTALTVTKETDESKKNGKGRRPRLFNSAWGDVPRLQQPHCAVRVP